MDDITKKLSEQVKKVVSEGYQPQVNHKFGDKYQGKVNDEENKAKREHLKDVEDRAHEFFKKLADESYELGGYFRGPGHHKEVLDRVKKIGKYYGGVFF